MPKLGRLRFIAVDTTGTAVSGATVEIRRQGATVNGTQAGPITSITVNSPNGVIVGDAVAVTADERSEERRLLLVERERVEPEHDVVERARSIRGRERADDAAVRQDADFRAGLVSQCHQIDGNALFRASER